MRKICLELKNAVKADSKHAGARWQLAQVYLAIENGPAAEKELKRARDLGVEMASVAIPLGESLLLQAKYRELLDTIL